MFILKILFLIVCAFAFLYFCYTIVFPFSFLWWEELNEQKEEQKFCHATRCQGCGAGRKIHTPTQHYPLDNPIWENQLPDVCAFCGSIHFKDDIGKPQKGTHIWKWIEKPLRPQESELNDALKIASDLEADPKLRAEVIKILTRRSLL